MTETFIDPSNPEGLLQELLYILDNAKSERDIESALEIYGNWSAYLSKEQIKRFLKKGLETEKRLGTEVDTWEL